MGYNYRSIFIRLAVFAFQSRDRHAAVPITHASIERCAGKNCVRLVRSPGTVVPEGLMFYNRCYLFNFYLFYHRISELRQPIATKLFHMITIWVCFIMQVQKFWGPPLKKFWGPKTCKFGPILHNFRL